MGAGCPRSWRDDVQEFTTAARAAAPQVTHSGPTRAARAARETRSPHPFDAKTSGQDDPSSGNLYGDDPHGGDRRGQPRPASGVADGNHHGELACTSPTREVPAGSVIDRAQSRVRGAPGRGGEVGEDRADWRQGGHARLVLRAHQVEGGVAEQTRPQRLEVGLLAHPGACGRRPARSVGRVVPATRVPRDAGSRRSRRPPARPSPTRRRLRARRRSRRPRARRDRRARVRRSPRRHRRALACRAVRGRSGRHPDSDAAASPAGAAARRARRPTAAVSAATKRSARSRSARERHASRATDHSWTLPEGVASRSEGASRSTRRAVVQRSAPGRRGNGSIRLRPGTATLPGTIHPAVTPSPFAAR